MIAQPISIPLISYIITSSHYRFEHVCHVPISWISVSIYAIQQNPCLSCVDRDHHLSIKIQVSSEIDYCKGLAIGLVTGVESDQ